MKKIVLSLFLLLLISTSIYSQKKIEQDLELADSLKEMYPDDYIVSLSTKETYSFILTKSKIAQSPVVIEMQSHQKLVSLTDFLHYEKSLLYDNRSRISDISMQSKKRRYGARTKDESYVSNGLFYSDQRIKTVDLYFKSKGQISTFKYEKKYYDSKYLASVYFHDVFPTKIKTVEFLIPDWLEIDLLEFNFEGYEIEKQQERNIWRGYTVHRFIIKELASFPDEANSPGPSHYLPHILVICKSVMHKKFESTMLKSTDDLYKWYHQLVKQINNDVEPLKLTVESLTENKETDVEKVKSIFYWVQDNIRYIAFEDGIAGFRPEACQHVFENRYGDCKGMANLTKEMLKLAGFDARLAWIGTNHIAYDYSIPSLAVDNHMICTLILDGKKYFIDPTEEYISFNDYAERIQGKEALIEDGENYIREFVPSFPSSRNKVEVVKQLTYKGGDLIGSSSSLYNGEAKTAFLQGYSYVRQDKKQDALEYFISQGDKNIIIEDVQTSDMEDRESILKLDYALEIRNHTSRFDDEIYINLDFDKEFDIDEFDEDRETDFLFMHKINLLVKIELEIPDGFEVKSIPEGLNKKTDDFSFNINYTIVDNKIVFTKEIIIEDGVLKIKDIELWKELIGELNKVYKSYIIISK